MSEVDDLINNYRRIVAMPWEEDLAAEEKIWFAVYNPVQERRIRLRLSDFEIATQQSGHKWRLLDLTDSFAEWMAGNRYREAYFESPEDITLALEDYADEVANRLTEVLSAAEVGENTVVAVQGVGSLFGLTRVSTIIERGASEIRGRLLVFFPGHYGERNYRLLAARDGWNYLAIPITPQEGG